VPDAKPPAFLVQFDPAQTSALDIGTQAKIALESDGAVAATTYAVSFVPAQPELLAVSNLKAVPSYSQVDLFANVTAPGTLTLSTPVFGCCADSVRYGLPQLLDGVQSVDLKNSGSMSVSLVVGFDPAQLTPDQIAEGVKEILETDQLLGSTVTIHMNEKPAGEGM